jgi:O-antigen/teichoic acid export membrane protein
MLLGALTGLLFTALYARPFLHIVRRGYGPWMRKLLGYGKYVLGTNLSAMFYKSIDKLALGQLIGPAAFAVYDAAGKITQLIETPSFSIASVVFPQSAAHLEERGVQGIQVLYERSVGAILAIILPFLITVLLFAEPIMLLFAGPKYLESANILRFTAFFGLFMPFAVQFGTILDSTGRPATNFGYTAGTAVLNLGLSFLLIRNFGLFGAAYATLTGYSISFVFMQQYLNRHYGIRWWQAFGFVPTVYKIGFEMLRQKLAPGPLPVEKKI